MISRDGDRQDSDCESKLTIRHEQLESLIHLSFVFVFPTGGLDYMMGDGRLEEATRFFST